MSRALKRLFSTARVPIVTALDVPVPGGTARVLASWLEKNPQAHVVALLGGKLPHPKNGDGIGEIARLLAAHSPEREDPPALMLSAAVEGVDWPRLLIFCKNTPPPAAQDARALCIPEPGEARLTFATARTRAFAPHELGTLFQVEATRQAVVAACEEAGLDPAGDELCFAKVQCPLLTEEQLGEARAAGRPALAETSAESAGLSRGASALGVGYATGDVKCLTQSDVCANYLRFSTAAAASARPAVTRSEVLVIGNAVGSTSTLRAAKAMMTDAADVLSVARALDAAGLPHSEEGRLTPSAHERVVALLAKADGASTLERPPLTEERWTDSDVRASQFACASVGASLRRLVGDSGPKGRIYVSGGAEHQGPAGGGPVCAIYSCLLGEEYWAHVREGYFP